MLLNGMNLERFLDNLFGEYEESKMEGIKVLKRSIRPSVMSSDCCTYNYACYGG